MAQQDRINGLVGNLANKAPCNCATTTAITLSGAQTIDGYSCTSTDNNGQGTRVLVKDQANPVDNGIYYCNDAAWTRAPDFDGAGDAAQGSRVLVVSGTVNANIEFQLTTANPVNIGVSSCTFVVFTQSANIHAATAKAVPVDADEIPVLDSVASFILKKFTIANLKAVIFGAWGVLTAAGTSKVTPDGADVIAIGDSAAANATKALSWTNHNAAVYAAIGPLIAAGTQKATPVSTDNFPISDSAAGNAIKSVSLANLITAVALNAFFASGTRLPFNQTSAPTGWTKDTTAALNDTAMRIVTGTVGSGGANAFSSAAYTPTLSGTIDSHVLTVAEMPSHTHQETASQGGNQIAATVGTGVASVTTNEIAVSVITNRANSSALNTQAQGGGTGHTHGTTGLSINSITLNLKYNDFIIATKN